jgi:isochorismate hydrolase
MVAASRRADSVGPSFSSVTKETRMQRIDNDATTAGRSGLALDPSRTALVIVDMQECFVADSPVSAALGTEVAARLNRLAGACRESGIAVIWTRHVAAARRQQRGAPRRKDPRGRSRGDQRGRTDRRVARTNGVRTGDIVLDKPRFGASTAPTSR